MYDPIVRSAERSTRSCRPRHLAWLLALAAGSAALPGLAEHNAYGQFKRMTLRQVAPFSGGNITDDIIAAIDADLKALPPA